MHNNFTIDRARSARKPFYTLVEAAVLLARAEGAKSAGDPRINHYTQRLFESLKSGELRASKTEGHASEIPGEPSLSPAVSFDDLKKWVAKHLPRARPAFLF